MSKYRAPWKEFDPNQDFWREVLIGRKVEAFGPGEKTVKIGGDPKTFLTEMLLDSGERVWLSSYWFGESCELPVNIIGKTISDVVWYEGGIGSLRFDDGGIYMHLPLTGWRICIQD